MKTRTLFDIKGNDTGIAVNKGLLIALFTALALYAVISWIDPLAAYGPLASKALGFLLASVFFMIFGGVPLAVVAMVIACTGVMTGLFSWKSVSDKLGSSAFYQALGMMIVAMGCEFTDFGYRFGYVVLKRFANHPIKLILAITAVSALLSTVVSNVAILIIMSSITHSILVAMGETPGESRIGKAAMLCIVMGSMAGGMGLFCGSPIGNTAVLSYMTAALDGADYSPTFMQWAVVAFPTLLICILPMAMVYVKWFRVRKDESVRLGRDYYEGKLQELGPMTGAEKRWLILLFGMILAMSLGMKTAAAAILFAALSMFPGIGVSDSRKVFKKIPWNPLIAICMLPLMSEVIVNTGLSEWLSEAITPLFSRLGPLGFSMVCSLTLALLINLLVNSMQATMALVMSVSAPICVALGYNPTIILLPAAMASSYMWVIGANQYVMMNKEYGWWEMKDTLAPGLISTLIPSIVAPIMACVFGPLFGMPLYL